MPATDLQRLLVGQDRGPMVVFEDGPCLVHREVVPALIELKRAAAAEGIDLAVASGFRGFERQLDLWNRKARGQLPLLDELERPVRAEGLTPEERMFAILRWSLLPGASRHHWGSDVDVFDRSTLPQGSPRLRRDETVPGALFGRLHAWLDASLPHFGFYRPYDEDRGGVSPEPWHLSHVRLGQSLQAAFSLELLERAIGEAQLELKESILQHLKTIHRQYITNVGSPGREA